MAYSAASILANGVHFFSEDPIQASTHSLKSERESDPATVATTPYPVIYTPSIGCKKKTTLKSRVASGDTLYGLFLMSASPTIAEIAGLAGYDFVVVDLEHGPGDISDALSCIRALAAAGTAAIIRVPEKSAAWTKKALDLGPQGIMFPMVENANMAEQVVSNCRYPPRSIRGTADVMVRASGYGTDDTYVHRCKEELLILCMVETETGVAKIEAIASVDGVDGIQMGPRDLGATMRYLKDPGNPKAMEVLLAAEKRVVAMQKPGRGPFLGGISTQQHKPEELGERGYNMIVGGVDVGLFRQAAVEDVQRFRRSNAAKRNNNPKVSNRAHVPSAA